MSAGLVQMLISVIVQFIKEGWLGKLPFRKAFGRNKLASLFIFLNTVMFIAMLYTTNKAVAYYKLLEHKSAALQVMQEHYNNFVPLGTPPELATQTIMQKLTQSDYDNQQCRLENESLRALLKKQAEMMSANNLRQLLEQVK